MAAFSPVSGLLPNHNRFSQASSYHIPDEVPTPVTSPENLRAIPESRRKSVFSILSAVLFLPAPIFPDLNQSAKACDLQVLKFSLFATAVPLRFPGNASLFCVPGSAVRILPPDFAAFETKLPSFSFRPVCLLDYVPAFSSFPAVLFVLTHDSYVLLPVPDTAFHIPFS